MTELLVTGASGLIGSRLAELARRAGYAVTTPARAELGGPLAGAQGSVSCVLHLAGGWAGANYGELAAADLSIAANLTCWARRAGVRRWVVASAAEVYGRVEGLGGEDAPLRPVIPYGAVKREVERRFIELARDLLGATVVLLRIGQVYGSRARLTRELAARLRGGWCPWPGRGLDPVSFVHVDYVAQAFLRAAAATAPGVHIYNVADAKPSCWRDFLRMLARGLGARPPVHIPVPLARLYAACSADPALTQAVDRKSVV